MLFDALPPDSYRDKSESDLLYQRRLKSVKSQSVWGSPLASTTRGDYHLLEPGSSWLRAGAFVYAHAACSGRHLFVLDVLHFPPDVVVFVPSAEELPCMWQTAERIGEHCATVAESRER